MKFTCKYKTGKEYGSQARSQNYVVSVDRNDNRIAIKYDFIRGPVGKSNPQSHISRISSLDLELTQAEAISLAVSILAQFHHPTIRNTTAKWIPPTAMPDVSEKEWRDDLVVQPSLEEKRVFVLNNTRYHLGEIVFDMKYRKSVGQSARTGLFPGKVIKLLDLAPGEEKILDITDNDFSGPGSRIGEIDSLEAYRVTGLVPGSV
jgi:hypothetical protein